MRKAVVVCLVFLTGCAAAIRAQREAEARRVAQQLVGQPVALAVQWWGAPTSEAPVGGGIVLQWESYGATHAAYGGGPYYRAASSWTEHCKRWVVADAGGVVTSANAQGDCR